MNPSPASPLRLWRRLPARGCLVGLALAALAAWLRWVGADWLTRLPADYALDVEYAVTTRSRQTPFGPAEVAKISAHRRDQPLKSGPRHLVLHGSAHWFTPSGVLIFETVNLYGVDRRTRANVAGYGNVSRHGQYLFPPRVAKTTYDFWDPLYAGPGTVRFLREETLEGLPVHVFEFSVDRLDESVGYAALPDVPERYRAVTNGRGRYWVEPRSGLIVDHFDSGISWFLDPETGRTVGEPIHEWRSRYAPETVRARHAAATRSRWTLQALEGWAPATLLAAGIAAIGVCAWRRQDGPLKAPLAARMLGYFGSLAGGLAVVVGVLAYWSGRENLEAAALADLFTEARHKESAVDEWVHDRLSDSEQLALEVTEKVMAWLATVPGTSAAGLAYEELQAEFALHVRGRRSAMLAVCVLHADTGVVVVSTRPELEGQVRRDQSYFEPAHRAPHVQPPGHVSGLPAPTMTMAVPVRTSDGHCAAVLAIHWDITSLSEGVQVRTGMHATVDTYLVDAEGYPVTRPRLLGPSAVLRQRIDSAAVREVVARRSGAVVADNYHGVPCFAVYRWHGQQHLGVISEIAVAEALAPVAEFGRSLVVITGGALLVAALLALRLAHVVAGPLRALHGAVGRLAAGDWSARAIVTSRDEFGDVADAFNRMVAQTAADRAALRELQQLHAAILAGASHGILGLNLRGEIVYANAAAARMLGAAPAELIGQPGHATFPAAPPVDTLRRKDGTSFPVECTFTATKNLAGEITGSVAVFSDISERKRTEAALHAAQRELLDASRRAGMAEIATGVLHNVGNVLNSVNVAATHVAQQLHDSKSAHLPRIAAMLEARAGDVVEFLTRDPQGRRIPHYLVRLGADLAAEREAVTEQLGQLKRHIDHIRDIVALQQDYARSPGVAETVHLPDLVEDALRMNSASFQRHGCEIVREFAALQPVSLDRSKVLQVLVNLIYNAKHACNDSSRPDKRVIVRVEQAAARLRVSVIDNGVGIPPENLTRIFAYGFTTRSGGHGFGLHNGALIAKALGGSLTAHSDGPGGGATFVLELPVRPPASETPPPVSAELSPSFS